MEWNERQVVYAVVFLAASPLRYSILGRGVVLGGGDGDWQAVPLESFSVVEMNDGCLRQVV